MSVPAPAYVFAMYDPKREAASEGGGSNITLLGAGYASITNGDLVIAGQIIGVALSDYEAGVGVAVNIDGCWKLPVKADAEIGDVVFFHDSAPDYLDCTAAGGIPIGIVIANGPPYTGTAVEVWVKLIPDIRNVVLSVFALTEAATADIVASIAEHVVFMPSQAGNISRAGFYCGNTGTDGTDSLSLEMDLQIGGVSIFTTKPKVDKTAVDGVSTFVAAAGVTVGVINTAADDFVANDLVELTGTLIRTTPEDEIALVLFIMEFTYG